MLDVGETAEDQSEEKFGEGCTMSIISVLGYFDEVFFTRDLLLKNEFVLISHQPLRSLFSY